MSHPFLAIVDDQPDVRNALSLYFSLAGYASETFRNGREFLDRHHPATSCVILDTYMPVLDGWDTLRELRDRRIDVPVITMCAVHGKHSGPGLFELGAREHFSKPFQLPYLLAAVRRAMVWCRD